MFPYPITSYDMKALIIQEETLRPLPARLKGHEDTTCDFLVILKLGSLIFLSCLYVKYDADAEIKYAPC